ncbi:NACHT domain-containing protein [Planomonospora parontospora subsp. parontospora]|uniref:NACHT domain-containing protein n=2 Tax=Planomonospora parontospora TaxID=58119 RepID=A0AA37BJ03_9ACTN|nr:NACHT domain-containing protein [Planomonospora parontospora]GGK78234.1 NACHT domain-containing protein [Planomonospora parontospora]GII10356.1 NACHT domain-containing protein [Planomonospora parontospora subsp. parontospora]
MPLPDMRGRRARIALVLAILTSAALATVMLFGRLDPGRKVGPDLLNELVGGVLIGIGGAVLKWVYEWACRRRPPPPVPDVAVAKTALAGLVNRQWREEARIRALGDPEPIPVAWNLTSKHALMDHPSLIAVEELSFSGCAGDVRRLAGQFRRLRCRRLVIAGGPGMGKTTLAVQLLLELIATRTDDEPVPVLLSVAGWDTGRHPRLHEWLGARLAADYPALCAAEYGGAGTPAALAGQGHVLPVLDGLDELPPPARAQVITALNGSLTDRDQVILTSRTSEFAAAVRSAGAVLTAAAVIVPAVLTPSAAAAYLRDCLPPVPAHDWSEVLAAVRSGSAPGLSAVAGTPLGLWLLRMVYVVPNADPTPLLGGLGADAKVLRAGLLDRLVGTLIRARPPTGERSDLFRPRRAWNPAQAYTWLGDVAVLLTRDGTRDLAWWRLARQAASPAVRRRLQAVAGLAAGAVSWSAFTAWLAATGPGAPLVRASVLASVFVVAFALGAGRWFHETPGFAEVRLRRLVRVPVRGIVGGLVIWAVTVLVAGGAWVLLEGAPGRTPWGRSVLVLTEAVFYLGLMVGLAAMLVPWVRQVEHPTSLVAASTPASVWAADRNLTLVRTIVLTGGFGAAFGLLLWRVAGDPADVLGAGLALGLTGGPAAALLFGHHHAWLACVLLLRTRATSLPVRLIPFLDDMHRLGLLRTTGPVYQFRHAELHDHLAAAAGLRRGLSPGHRVHPRDGSRPKTRIVIARSLHDSGR